MKSRTRREAWMRPAAGAAALVALTLGLVARVDVAGQQPRPNAQPRPNDQQRPNDQEGFRFRSGVDLVNVTVTVTDATGRFVPGLKQEDFLVYEDGEAQQIAFFSAERVPVSLGITVDTSGSMAGEKMSNAKSAIDRFLYELLDEQDEIFIARFSDRPDLLQDWTTNRERLSRAVRGMMARGGTALYDAVADAVPLAQSGQLRKKALLVISDGNDTSSAIGAGELRQVVRQTEVLVYAIAIDGRGEGIYTGRGPTWPPGGPGPMPFPIPGRRGGPTWPGYPPTGGGSGGGVWTRGGGDGANVAALRAITDDSGGRTEVVRDGRDLDGATSGIADELSRQYSLGYSSTRDKDGRWHAIRVDLKNRTYRVRARRGYIATP